MVIKDEKVIDEGLQGWEITTCDIELPFWRDNVTRSLREIERVTNRLAFTIVMQDFVSKDQLRALLQVVETRKNFLIKPIPDLVVS